MLCNLFHVQDLPINQVSITTLVCTETKNFLCTGFVSLPVLTWESDERRGQEGTWLVVSYFFSPPVGFGRSDVQRRELVVQVGAALDHHFFKRRGGDGMPLPPLTATRLFHGHSFDLASSLFSFEGKKKEVLFSSEKWKFFGTVVLSFVYDKYYLIMN